MPRRSGPFVNNSVRTYPGHNRSADFRLISRFKSNGPCTKLTCRIVSCRSAIRANELSSANSNGMSGRCQNTLALGVGQRCGKNRGACSFLRKEQRCPLPVARLRMHTRGAQFFSGDNTHARGDRTGRPASFCYRIRIDRLIRRITRLPPVSGHGFRPTGRMLLVVQRRSAYTENRSNASVGATEHFNIKLLPGQRRILRMHPLQSLHPILSATGRFYTLGLCRLTLVSALDCAPFNRSPSRRPMASVGITFPAGPADNG